MAQKLSPVSERSTKAEILDAYQMMLEQINTSPEESPQKKDEKKIVEKAKTETSQKIIQDLTQLKLTVNQTINSLTESLTQEAEKLETLRKAIELTEQDMADTTKVKVASENLYKLIELHNQKEQEFSEELRLKRQGWQEEQKEYEERTKKERSREQSEYDYQQQQSRKREQDEYDEEKRRREREKAEYENALKEREQLKQHVAEFPAQLDAEIKSAVLKATSEVQKETQHKEALTKQQNDSDKKLAQLRIDSLESQNTQLHAEINELKKRLDEATHHVKDIAVAVVENKKDQPLRLPSVELVNK